MRSRESSVSSMSIDHLRCGALMRGSFAGDRLVGRGDAPMDEPLPELLELEPDDIHMEKRL